MRTRVKIIVAVAGVALIAAIVWQVARSREPVYNGKRLTAWLTDWPPAQPYLQVGQQVYFLPAQPCWQPRQPASWQPVYRVGYGTMPGGRLNAFPYNSVPGKLEATSLEAAEAVRQIGSEAIPTLLRLLRTRDSGVKMKLFEWVQRQHVIKISYTPAENWNLVGLLGFGILGTNAASAVPALVQIANANVSPCSRICAIRALGYIGPPAKEAVPSLLQWATNAEAGLRSPASRPQSRIIPYAVATASLGPQWVTNTDMAVLEEAIASLGCIGPGAKQAVPYLVQWTTNADAVVQIYAKSALLTIAPETFAAMFDSLSIADKLRLLQEHWDKAKTPALLPALVKLLRAPPDTSGLDLRNWALARAYELDPKAGRPLVLAEIKSPPMATYGPPRLHMDGLLSLPDETLPEMDETFILQLIFEGRAEDLNLTGRLISRYGTRTIEPQVKAFYEPAAGRWACDLQASFLAYFLRVDEPYGVKAFAQSLASRQTGCWYSLFGDVGERVWTPGLEKLAVEALANRDAVVAASAAGMLKRKGVAEVKAKLLEALRQRYVPNPPGTDLREPRDPTKARRDALIDALLNGHAWVLTPDELAMVKSYVDDKPLASMLQRAMPPGTVTLRLGLRFDGKPDLGLDSETYSSLAELQRKVSLYPTGTVFKVPGSNDADNPVRKEFLNWAKTRNLKVESGP